MRIYDTNGNKAPNRAKSPPALQPKAGLRKRREPSLSRLRPKRGSSSSLRVIPPRDPTPFFSISVRMPSLSPSSAATSEQQSTVHSFGAHSSSY